MSDIKISQLPPYLGDVTPLGDMPISINGVTYRITPEQLLGGIPQTVEPLQFGEMRRLSKGYQQQEDASYVKNVKEDDERGDMFYGTQLDGYVYVARWNGFTDGIGKNDIINYAVMIRWKAALPGEPDFEI